VNDRKSFLLNRLNNIISVKFSNHTSFQELYKDKITNRSLAESKKKTAEAIAGFYKICNKSNPHVFERKHRESSVVNKDVAQIFSNEMLRTGTHFRDSVNTPNSLRAHDEAAPRDSTQCFRESRNKIFDKMEYLKSLRGKSFEDLTQEIEKVTGKSMKKVDKVKPNKTYECGLLTVHGVKGEGIGGGGHQHRLSKTIEKDIRIVKKIKPFSRIRTAEGSKTMLPRVKYIKNMRLRKTHISEPIDFTVNKTGSQFTLTSTHNSMLLKKITQW
jgi:hypothetical protein